MFNESYSLDNAREVVLLRTETGYLHRKAEGNRLSGKAIKDVRRQPMERRRLVGRRYEDYLKNDIIIELTAEEHIWRMVILDPRYNALIDRRRNVRRKTDTFLSGQLTIFQPDCSFMLIEHFKE